jgi:ATP-dependent DNA helicase RecG
MINVISTKLNELLSLSSENECLEFKEAKNTYDFDKLGKYFSALCNEANLGGKNEAWLIFGVKDEGHLIVGTNFRPNPVDLQHLKAEIANHTTNRITFIEIYELQTDRGRVILFQIPPAPNGLPVAWNGHYYGRDGEDLSPLNLEELDRIRRKATFHDWSADI